MTKREKHNFNRPRHRHRRSFRQALKLVNTKWTSVVLLSEHVRQTPRTHRSSPSKLCSGTHADSEYNALAVNAAQRRTSSHTKKQKNNFAHQQPHGRAVEKPLFHEIKNSPGRSNDDITRALQQRHRWSAVCPAHQQGVFYARGGKVLLEARGSARAARGEARDNNVQQGRM